LSFKTRLMIRLQDDILEAKHNSLESAFREQAAGAYAMALRVDEDLSALNQRLLRFQTSKPFVNG